MAKVSSEIAGNIASLEALVGQAFSLKDFPVKQTEEGKIDVLGVNGPKLLETFGDGLGSVLKDIYGNSWRQYLKKTNEGIEVDSNAPKLFKEIYASCVAQMLMFRNYLKSYLSLTIDDLNINLGNLKKGYEANKKDLEDQIKIYDKGFKSVDGSLGEYLNK